MYVHFHMCMGACAYGGQKFTAGIFPSEALHIEAELYKLALNPKLAYLGLGRLGRLGWLGRPVCCCVAQISLLLQPPKCRDYDTHVTMPSLIRAPFDNIPDVLPASSCTPGTKASISLLSCLPDLPISIFTLEW